MSLICDIISLVEPKFILLKYQLIGGKVPFDNWFNALDETTKARIDTRLDRLSLGNFGDCKLIKNGIFELRFFFGSGYRLYFGRDGNKVIILLFGGDKRTQAKDIRVAQELWNNYLYERKK